MLLAVADMRTHEDKHDSRLRLQTQYQIRKRDASIYLSTVEDVPTQRIFLPRHVPESFLPRVGRDPRPSEGARRDPSLDLTAAGVQSAWIRSPVVHPSDGLHGRETAVNRGLVWARGLCAACRRQATLEQRTDDEEAVRLHGSRRL